MPAWTLWNDVPYAGTVVAPVGKPPFQLYCLLLTLDFAHALHFELQCRLRLGVEDEDCAFWGCAPFVECSSPSYAWSCSP